MREKEGNRKRGDEGDRKSERDRLSRNISPTPCVPMSCCHSSPCGLLGAEDPPSNGIEFKGLIFN